MHSPRLEFSVTCSPGGAGKWHPDYVRMFEHARVIVLPENDEAGRKHAEQVAQSLREHAASVQILQLPVPERGDAFDWCAAGGTAKLLWQLVEAIEAAPAIGGDEETDWLRYAMCDDKGRPLANLANALLGLRSDPKLKNALAF